MKKLFKLVLIFIIVIIIVVMIFKVKIIDIEVLGSERQDGSKVISQIFEDERDHTSITFFIKDLLGIKKEVQYVDTYKVEWVTPFSIRIVVDEKPFVGFIKKDILNVFFDRDGIVSEMTEKRVKNVPEIRGINFETFEKGKRLGAKETRIVDELLILANSLRDEGLDASLIEFDKDEKVSVYVGQIRVDLGDTANMPIKIARLIDIYPKIKDLSGSLDLSEAKENMNDEQYIFKKS